jgi:hypothetical protein
MSNSIQEAIKVSRLLPTVLGSLFLSRPLGGHPKVGRAFGLVPKYRLMEYCGREECIEAYISVYLCLRFTPFTNQVSRVNSHLYWPDFCTPNPPYPPASLPLSPTRPDQSIYTEFHIPLRGSAVMAAEDRGPQLAAVAILFLTLAWIFVSLRCYVRTVMMKSFGMDDWLAVASLVSWASSVCRSSHKSFVPLDEFRPPFCSRTSVEYCTIHLILGPRICTLVSLLHVFIFTDLGSQGLVYVVLYLCPQRHPVWVWFTNFYVSFLQPALIRLYLPCVLW